MSVVNQLKQKIRFRGKSFLAMVLAPEMPMNSWFEEIDRILNRSPGFFSGRPIMLDCSGLEPGKTDFKQLLDLLNERAIRVMGIEGVDEKFLEPGMPPVVSGGRSANDFTPEESPATSKPSQSASKEKPKTEKKDVQNKASNRIIDHPIRSGQTIFEPDGDLIVIGSISSGAELIAGGSIHVYGTLRGRALAGTKGGNNSRIFCSKLDAELISIDGVYKSAEDISSEYLNVPVQIHLESDDLVIVKL